MESHRENEERTKEGMKRGREGWRGEGGGGREGGRRGEEGKRRPEWRIRDSIKQDSWIEDRKREALHTHTIKSSLPVTEGCKQTHHWFPNAYTHDAKVLFLEGYSVFPNLVGSQAHCHC